VSKQFLLYDSGQLSSQFVVLLVITIKFVCAIVEFQIFINTFNATLFNYSILLGGLKLEDEEACLAALFLTNPLNDRNQLIQINGSRVEGTRKWIKSNKLYDSWLHSQSQLLWLSGSPGKGKTMLFNPAINVLR